MGLECTGLAEPIRELCRVRASGPRHLRGVDRARPAPSRPDGHRGPAKRLRAPGPELRGRLDGRGLGDEPLRAVFIRAPWIERRRRRRGPRASSMATRSSARRAQRARRRLPPRAHRRPSPARAVPVPGAKSEPAVERARSARMKDQRAEALARILVGYSCEVKAGDICVIQAETAAEPLAARALRGGAGGRRFPCRGSGRWRGRPRPSSSRLRRAARLDLRRRRAWAADESDVRFRHPRRDEHEGALRRRAFPAAAAAACSGRARPAVQLRTVEPAAGSGLRLRRRPRLHAPRHFLGRHIFDMRG